MTNDRPPGIEDVDHDTALAIALSWFDAIFTRENADHPRVEVDIVLSGADAHTRAPSSGGQWRISLAEGSGHGSAGAVIAHCRGRADALLIQRALELLAWWRKEDMATSLYAFKRRVDENKEVPWGEGANYAVMTATSVLLDSIEAAPIDPDEKRRHDEDVERFRELMRQRRERARDAQAD